MIPAVRPALLLVGIAATVGLVLLALLLLSAPGANAQTDTLLVKNTNQSVDFEVNFGGAVRSRAQVFETGPHARGYRLSAIGLSFGPILNTHLAGADLTATLNAVSGSNPGAVLCTLTDPASFARNSVNTFGAPSACPTLDPGTTYFFVVAAANIFSSEAEAKLTDSDSEDLGGAEGWTIANGSRADFAGTWASSSTLLIEVRGAKFVGLGEVQVKNTGQTADSTTRSLDTDTPKTAQPFTTGTNEGGYTLSSVRMKFDDINNFGGAKRELTATINEVGNGGPSDTVLCTLTSPAYIQKDSVNAFRASAGCLTLAPETEYFFVLERTGFAAGDIKFNRLDSDDEDSGAAPGWSIHDYSFIFDSTTAWGDETSSLMMEVWADANFPPSRSRWSSELSPDCPPAYGSCGYLGNEGGTLTNNNPLAPAGLNSRYKVERLTWWLDGNSGYVKLVMTALNTDGSGNVTSGSNSSKNREAAIDGKFPEFDYLRLAISEHLRDNPYHRDFKFGPDETLANPGPGRRYSSANDDVTFVWKMTKAH